MARNIVIQLDDDVEVPPILAVSGKSQVTFRLIIESLLAQGLAYIPGSIDDPLSIDSPDMATVNVAYKDLGQNLSPGSLVVVNPNIAPVFDALLETAIVIPAEMPNVTDDYDQTIRLTLGEGIQDPIAGRMFDRYFRALQTQDYDALNDVFDPDVRIFSIIDESGQGLLIDGRENVIKNQKTRWDYWIEKYGPVTHEFVSTFISTNTALLRFSLSNTNIIFGSIYTLSDYRITSIRHLKFEEDPVPPTIRDPIQQPPTASSLGTD